MWGGDRQFWGGIGLVAGTALLAGCGGYESTFSCKGYADKPWCRPVSDVYADRFSPAQLTIDQQKAAAGDSQNGNGKVMITPSLPPDNAMAGKAESVLGKPIVKPARTFQSWIAPWKDDKRRLHEAQMVYVIVENSEFIYGQSTGKGTGTGTTGRSREMYPRKGRMVEEAAMRKASGSPSSSGAVTKSSSAGSPSSSMYDDNSQAPGSGMSPSPVPQGFPPVVPSPSRSGSYLVDQGALGGPAFP